MSQKNIFFKNDTIYFSEMGKKGRSGCERERDKRRNRYKQREREQEWREDEKKKERARH